MLALTPVAAQAQATACSAPDRIPVPRLERPARDEPVRKPPTTGYLLSMSWSPQHCADVRNPKDVVPGGSMSFPGLRNDQQINDLMAYLQAQH